MQNKAQMVVQISLMTRACRNLDSGASSHYEPSASVGTCMGELSKKLVKLVPNGTVMDSMVYFNTREYEARGMKSRCSAINWRKSQQSSRHHLHHSFSPKPRRCHSPLLKRHQVHADKRGSLQGWMDIQSSLWWATLKNQPNDEINNTIFLDIQSPLEMVNKIYDLPSFTMQIWYLHEAEGYPLKVIWLRVIRNGNYSSCTGITVEAVERHFSESVEIQKKYTWSNNAKIQDQRKVVKMKSRWKENNDKLNQRKKHDIYARVIEPKEIIYPYQTGKFPVRSVRGNQYIMVMTKIDSLYIDAEPFKAKFTKDLIDAYKKFLDLIKSSRKIDPKLCIQQQNTRGI